MHRFSLAVVMLLVAGCARSSTTTAPPTLEAASSTPASAPVKTTSYTKPSDAELKARLTPLQYEVTQKAATEPPFRNTYWDNHADGIYVDVVSGVPLFSSRDKFESGTGWPSFTRTIANNVIVETSDETLGMERTEVVSKAAGSHLGHVFDDGPAPTHKRYCMNSASLRFVPASRLAAEGYGQYAAAFGVAPTADSTPAAPSSNSCVTPPPGKKAGCSSTLGVATFTGLSDDKSPPAGVLEVEKKSDRVEVTFDPAKISQEEVRAWAKARGGHDAP